MKKQRRSFLIFMTLTMLLAPCSVFTPVELPPTLEAGSTPTVIAAAGTPPPTPSSPSIVQGPIGEKLDEYLNASEYFIGSAMVVQNGNVLLEKGYSYANWEHEVPNTPQTKFAIGSITKSFTAMGIMMLQESGLLSVNDPVCDYIDNCPITWKKITLHQLLNHTSGIPSYTDEPIVYTFPDLCSEYTTTEVLSYFRDEPLMFEPGSQWYYSNSGYFLLGMVIEKVSGITYERFMQENIFDPLGMNDSGYDRASDIVPHRASGYSHDGDKYINAPCWDASQKYAAGALYSTVGDMYKWDQAYYNESLVSQATIDQMTASGVPAEEGYEYGYGWMMTSHDGHPVVEHSGGVLGFVAHIARYPDDKLTIIVLINLEFADQLQISRDLANIVFNSQ